MKVRDVSREMSELRGSLALDIMTRLQRNPGLVGVAAVVDVLRESRLCQQLEQLKRRIECLENAAGEPSKRDRLRLLRCAYREHNERAMRINGFIEHNRQAWSPAWDSWLHREVKARDAIARIIRRLGDDKRE